MEQENKEGAKENSSLSEMIWNLCEMAEKKEAKALSEKDESEMKDLEKRVRNGLSSMKWKSFADPPKEKESHIKDKVELLNAENK